MKTLKYNHLIMLLTVFVLVFAVSCERDLTQLEEATYPVNGEVFIDGFSSGLQYQAWGDVTAFDVDSEVKYMGTASMKFAVPDEGETGGYAGGSFMTSSPRDLSEFNALTFWVKATKAAEIDVIGFGNNSSGSTYLTTLYGVKVNTNWKKIIIPIADPSKLIAETGMLYYSEAPEDGSGYTFWLDEVQFEKIGTIAHAQPMILEGQDQTTMGVTGQVLELGGTSVTYNMPTGLNQKVYVTAAYFDFQSSDESVASVNEFGQVTLNALGNAVITAGFGEETAAGSIAIDVINFESAPAPEIDESKVISVFSDAYTNVAVDYYNGYWAEGQTTKNDIFNVGGDNVLSYYDLNWVGIQFSEDNSINATGKTHLHLDLFIPAEVADGEQFKVEIASPDGLNSSATVSTPELVSETWISVDVPLTTAHIDNLFQIIFSNGGSTLSAFYVDNIYFYEGEPTGGGDDEPTEAAPTPSQSAADVMSIYSDAYTNLDGTNLNPDWGQATVMSEVSVAGNNTILYTGLTYQGIELAGGTDVSAMSNLHIDFWTANSTALNIYLISSGDGAETVYALTVPTTGWSSLDIPLTAFTANVDLTDVIQFKFDGDGDIYIDNLFFYTGGGSGGNEPTVAAPAPTHDAADVISIFSDSYENLEGTDYPNWGQTSILTEALAGDNPVLKLENMNFQGIELASTLDASQMTHIHIDVWSPNFEQFSFKLVDFGADGGYQGGDDSYHQIDYPSPAQGQWVSYDIPLTDFTGLASVEHIAQMVLECQPLETTTLYFDNIYFHK